MSERYKRILGISGSTLTLTAIIVILLVLQKGEVKSPNISEYGLCREINILTLRKVKVSQKTTEKGIIIVMTSPDVVKIEKLRQIVLSYRAANSRQVRTTANELLKNKDIQLKMVELNNGLLLELWSDDLVLQKQIKQLMLAPRFPVPLEPKE